MTQPFSLQIFLPFGEPSGLRIIDRPNWTGQGIAFPRERVKQALESEEIRRTGVYVLWNRDESETMPQAYIGQGERLNERILSHEREKQFWTDAVAFTTKDDSLNRAHVLYLEARLLQLAREAGRCALENKTIPPLPNVGKAVTADTERYLDDLLDCLPIIGVSFISTPQPISSGSMDGGPEIMSIDFTNSKSPRLAGVRATGYESAGGFVIVEGSLVVRDEADAFPIRFPRESAYRKQLIEQGVLVEDETQPNAYRFTRSHACSSPSRAAGIIRGTASNGREDWKDANGRSLNDLAELDRDDPQ